MKHRLFIAINLPDEIISAILALSGRLESLHLPLRLEEPEKLHITLNFLGRVEEKLIPSVQKILTHTAALQQSFQLAPVYLDSMYKKHADSYVYLGLSGDLDILKQIHKSLSLSLSQISIPQPERLFPHITIARFQKADPVTIKTAMDKITDFEFTALPEFTVAGLTLYESFLSQKGSHYRVIGHYPLK